MAFLQGFLVGIGMIIFLGPVFFTLLGASLQHGWKAGTAVAFGIIISDLLCVSLCLIGLSPLLENPTNQQWIGWIGGVLLMAMGIHFFRKKISPIDWETQQGDTKTKTLFAKGFLVNFVNPFVFLIWMGIIGVAKTSNNSTTDFYLYLSAVLCGILLTDLLKVYFAQKIKPYIQPTFLTKAFKTIAILLFAFGVRMIYMVSKGD